MSDAPMGEGWWMASDGKWYPPQPTQEPAAAPPPAPPEPPVSPAPPMTPPPPGFPPPAPYPPQPGGYGYAPPMPMKPKSSTDAIVWVSLGFGVAAIILSVACGVFGAPLGLVSIITGIVGLSQKKKKNEPENKWAAWVGIGTGVLSFLITILFVVFVALSASSSTSFS